MIPAQYSVKLNLYIVLVVFGVPVICFYRPEACTVAAESCRHEPG